MKYTYNELSDFIAHGRSKIDRKIENNTMARLGEDRIVIRFHSTDIAQILQDNTIILNSGGYKTFTTKDRMNKILPNPFRIYQNAGIWYIWNYITKVEYPYIDGITINPDSSITNYGVNPQELIKLRNRIKTYSKGFVTALCKGKVNKPYPGDCFYCVMRNVSSNIPLGESCKDVDHLLSHFREKYYVGSLLYRAIELYPMSLFANSELCEIWYDESIPDRFIVLPQQAYKSLVKYLYSQFDLPY